MAIVLLEGVELVDPYELVKVRDIVLEVQHGGVELANMCWS